MSGAGSLPVQSTATGTNRLIASGAVPTQRTGIPGTRFRSGPRICVLDSSCGNRFAVNVLGELSVMGCRTCPASVRRMLTTSRRTVAYGHCLSIVPICNPFATPAIAAKPWRRWRKTGMLLPGEPTPVRAWLCVRLCMCAPELRSRPSPTPKKISGRGSLAAARLGCEKKSPIRIFRQTPGRRYRCQHHPKRCTRCRKT